MDALKIVRIIIPALLLLTGGCSGIVLKAPVWLGDSGVSEMCEESGLYSFTHGGVTKEFAVHLIEVAEIYDVCDTEDAAMRARACIVNDYSIYVSSGINCPADLAHELSHGFGNHFVDQRRTFRQRSYG